MAPQTRTGKKRGEYKTWQFGGRDIPRSTLYSRRVSSSGGIQKKQTQKGSVKKGVPGRPRCVTTATAAPTPHWSEKENTRPEATTNTNILAAPSCSGVTGEENLLRQVSTNGNSSSVLGSCDSPCVIPTAAASCSSTTDKEYACEASLQTELVPPDGSSAECSIHAQDDPWIVVPEDMDDDDSDQDAFDEEEPFTLRLDMSDEDMTAVGNDVEGEGDEESESDSDEELATAPDFHLASEETVKLLLLLATKQRHKLSYTGAEDIMELAGVLDADEKGFLPTRHTMKSAIEKFSFALSEHHICPHCSKYIGIVFDSHFHCAKCHRRVNTKKNRKSGNMFLYLSLTDQIKALLEALEDDDFNYRQKRSKINECNYEDIYDGAYYKSSKVEPGTLTFNFFVDGLQVATTSKQSAWPVLVSINELSLHLRRKHILMACVWLSKQKPDCNEYLKPFVKEVRDLATNGVTFTRTGVTKTVKVKPCMCISDSIARPLLRNSKQFNGKFGCGLCYHPGVSMRRGKGKTRSYSTKERTYPLRTHDELMEHATRADRLGKPEKGIKGKSVLSDLPDFDMVRCIDLDSFHAIVNVAKRFCFLWFDKKSSGNPYYIHAKIDEVDRRLLKITPNSDISRAPRSITERSDYRGHEWFYFVLVYSVPVLKNILPLKYLNHWSLLVHGLALVFQNSVAKSEVVYSGRYLNQFVSEIDDLYGAENVTFSIHLLTHLGRSVFDFSQPWTHSAFIYESYMNEIKSSVKSSNGVALQISKAMQLKVAVQKIEIEFSHSMTAHQKCFLDRMLTRGKKVAAPHLILPSAAFLGKPSNTFLSLEAKRAITRAGVQCNTLISVPVYYRCKFQGEVFHSKMYSKESKQNNSVVLLDSGEVFLIESFIVIEQDCFMLGYYFPKSKKKLVDVLLPHFYVLSDSPESIVRCIRPSQVVCKLISFTVDISSSERVHVGCVNVLKLEMLS